MKTVLIADDEVYIRLILDINLKAKNLNVVTCRDGQEAFETAVRVMPDLVVTDLQMPFMDGLQLAQALHQLPETAEIPLLMLTARGHLLSDAEKQNTNIHAIMEKPFSPREFMRRVEELLDLDFGAENDGESEDGDDDDLATRNPHAA